MNGLDVLDTDLASAWEALRGCVAGGLDAVSEDDGYIDLSQEFLIATSERAADLVDSAMMDDAPEGGSEELVAMEAQLFEDLVWSEMQDRFKDRIAAMVKDAVKTGFELGLEQGMQHSG